jgi:hypothetical protein
MRHSFMPVIFAVFVTSLDAQQPAQRFQDSSARAILRMASANGRNYGLVTKLLRDANVTSATKGEVADSMAARVIRNRIDAGSGSESYALAVRALNVVAASGVAHGQAGQPFVGAIDRLIRIHRESSARQIRRRALAALLAQDDAANAMAYVEQVAKSSSDGAVDAVGVLIDDVSGINPSGTPSDEERKRSDAVLRRLHKTDLVENAEASRDLKLWFLRQPGT